MNKSLAVLAALALTATTPAFAQTKMAPVKPGQNMPGKGRSDHKTPEQRAAHRTEHLTKELGLSADQQAKVQQIMLAQGQEAKAVREKYLNADQRKAMAQEMKTSREKYDAQLKGVLSADQYNKLLAQRSEHRKKMRGAHDGSHKAKAKG